MPTFPRGPKIDRRPFARSLARSFVVAVVVVSLRARKRELHYLRHSYERPAFIIRTVRMCIYTFYVFAEGKVDGFGKILMYRSGVSQRDYAGSEQGSSEITRDFNQRPLRRPVMPLRPSHPNFTRW